jgi:hypothetical protein
MIEKEPHDSSSHYTTKLFKMAYSNKHASLRKPSIIITLNYFFDLLTVWTETTETIKLREII